MQEGVKLSPATPHAVVDTLVLCSGGQSADFHTILDCLHGRKAFIWLAFVENEAEPPIMIMGHALPMPTPSSVLRGPQAPKFAQGFAINQGLPTSRIHSRGEARCYGQTA